MRSSSWASDRLICRDFPETTRGEACVPNRLEYPWASGAHIAICVFRGARRGRAGLADEVGPNSKVPHLYLQPPGTLQASRKTSDKDSDPASGQGSCARRMRV